MSSVSQESESNGQVAGDAPRPDADRLARLHYARQVMQRGMGGAQEDDYRKRVRDLWRSRPLFEIFLFLKKGGETLLADSIDSLAGQYYDGWRLAIFAPTPSPEPGFTHDEGVVRWIRISEDVPLAEAVNARFAASAADWVGFFACGTRFSPDFLLSLGDYVALHPEWRLIYTDEDAFDAEGELHTPLFKPDFNLELLRSTDYIGGLAVDRRALVAAGGYPSLDGAACYDVALRMVDACGERSAGHIAEVLQHVPPAAFCRAGTADAATALSAHLARRGIDAEIREGLAGNTRQVIYRHPGTPKVSIIIPTRNRIELLGPCVESLLRHTAWPNWELLLVDNGSDDARVPAYYDALGAALPERVRILNYPGQFNYSAMNNLAAREAHGEYLLLLNNDIECIHDDWLDALMSQAQRPDVGLVGARLLHPDSLKIQHAGIILGLLGGGEHVFYDAPHDDPGYLDRAVAAQEYSAVTGACQLLRKALFEKVGGLDEQFRVYCSDADLCLKIRQHGCRIVWTPFATLLHHGAGSLRETRRNDPKQEQELNEEIAFFGQRWKETLVHDPAWNRNLSLASTWPVVEDELAAPWNPDFHDRPRVAAMPAINNDSVGEYRFLAPLRALHAAGKVHYTAVCLPRSDCQRAPTPIELARMAPDTLIMHAPIDNIRCQALLHYQRLDANIFRVYALDDLITDIPRENPAYDHLPAEVTKERLQLGLAASHRLIVSTEPLAEACRQWIDDIRIVPNTLDWRVWGKLSSRRRRGPRLRVGWAGAQQHTGDLRLLRDVVAATRHEVDWVFLSMMPEGLDSCAVEFHSHVPFADYPAKLASLDLDLAVAPLEQHPFNEAKSNLRLLEYGALGWPVLCTDIFPYRTDDPPVVRLANDAGKWIAAIRERAADPDALACEGDAQRAWVKKHYLLENRLDQWFAALTR